jgi:hypothetical protein
MSNAALQQSALTKGQHQAIQERPFLAWRPHMAEYL